MGGKHRKCVICHEKESTGEKKFFAAFPLDENRCKQWVRVVGVQELVHVPIEKLNQLRYLCGKHFEKKDFNKKGNRLKKRAIPKLNLSAVPLTDEQLIGFPQHVWTDVHVTDAVPSTSLQNMPPSTVEKCENFVQPETAPSTSCHKMLPSSITEHQEEELTPITHPSPPCSEKKKRRGLDFNLAKVDLADAVPSTSHQNMPPSITEKCENFVRPEEIPSKSDKKTLSSSITENWENEFTPITNPKTPCAEKKKKTKLDINLDLTPRKKKLLEKLKKTQCTLASLKKSAKIVESIDSPVLKEFVIAAFQNQKRKPQGRRWSTTNKISALAIYKRSPKAYRYLQHIMPLPSPKTLNNVLRKIPMEPGLNSYVINHLQNVAKEKSVKDKQCGLVFDEMALKPRLIYNLAMDQVDGYQDFGKVDSSDDGRRDKMCDHVLLFMLQGIHMKFKQPIAFYFVKGTISSEKLSVLIKDIIRAVSETGFNIITTICDQGPTNVGALKLLKNFSGPGHDRDNYFIFDDKKIYIIFDIPHLFKSIRNNFLNNGQLVMDNKTAKWAHLLELEIKNRPMLYLCKVTPTHVQPKYRAKMKVKYAAQILSNTVAAVLKLMSESEKDEKIMETALIIQDLDKLFNFTNGPASKDDIKKGIRENVSSKSNHINVWAEFRRKIEGLKFINNSGVEAKNVRCIQGFLISLNSLQDIWQKLSGLGYKYLNLRQLNQDAIENLFGLIRQHSPTDKNPTCSGFMGALKTSVVSGMTAPHNKSSNCEKDFKKLLTNFHDLVFNIPGVVQSGRKASTEELQTQVGSEVNAEVPYCDFELDTPVLSLPEEFDFVEIENDLTKIDAQPLVYVSGYIASTIFKKHDCNECRINITNPNPECNPIYAYIKLREWWDERTSLTYPSINFCRTIDAAIKVFEEDIKPFMYKKNICQLCVTLFITKGDTSWFSCTNHAKEIFDIVFVRLGRLLIRRQCQRINQGLSMRDEELADAAKKAQQQGIAR